MYNSNINGLRISISIRIPRLCIYKYRVTYSLSFRCYFAYGAPLMQHTNYRELKKELMSFASFSFYSLLTIAINRFSENQKCIIYWYLLSVIDPFVAKWEAWHLRSRFDRYFSLRINLEGKCNLLKIWLHKNLILSAHENMRWRKTN